MLTSREAQILLYLNRNFTKYITVKDIATHFSISERTTRYELKDIDDWLRQNDLPALDKKPKKGINFKIPKLQ